MLACLVLITILDFPFNQKTNIQNQNNVVVFGKNGIIVHIGFTRALQLDNIINSVQVSSLLCNAKYSYFNLCK